MTRISLNPPRTLFFRVTEWYSRRMFGKSPDPLKVMGHHPQILRHLGLFELGVGRWKKLGRRLQGLALLASSARIGCEWCIDYGYWELHLRGVPRAKIEAISSWRSSDVYTDLERLVMEYSEAMTDTPPSVDDKLTEELRRHLSEAQLVELTALVAVENLRSRINAAAGLTGQGFNELCDIRLNS